MSESTQHLLKDALALPAIDRAELAEGLLSSLDRPDRSIDELWAQEVEDRLSAFRAGQMKAISSDDVFAEFETT